MPKAAGDRQRRLTNSMPEHKGAAIAHPNIALIKYWGNRDSRLRLPANSSLSMTLGGLRTHTQVTFSPGLDSDRLLINGQQASPAAHERTFRHLDLFREMSGVDDYAAIESHNSFPLGAGIASSASAFAALTVAACEALDLPSDGPTLSRLARRGSGSASRSIFGGFVQWNAADSDEDCYAEPIAPADHWELHDWIAVVSKEEKSVGSTRGHELASSSPLQSARVQHTSLRLDECRRALMAKDFAALARVVELDSDMMHAVMMTSSPPLQYWLPATLEVMHRVRQLRADGLPVCYTLDAGPNVHCLCPPEQAEALAGQLRALTGVTELLHATPGGPAHSVDVNGAPPK
ncbi:MAG: diphosphomevalonate decarboxylase [Anaerolineales bacterium]|nr:diphosphomevalonate decarboxylase [Anaerolineales bacterium]